MTERKTGHANTRGAGSLFQILDNELYLNRAFCNKRFTSYCKYVNSDMMYVCFKAVVSLSRLELEHDPIGSETTAIFVLRSSVISLRALCRV